MVSRLRSERKLGNPDKDVIAISGDGGMQMNIQEFATAVLEELPLILCVFNNEYLGMVRQWQKLFYGKRYSMTNLKSGALFRRTNGQEMPEYTPDFVKLAESYGAKGIRVMKKEDIAAAFEEAKEEYKDTDTDRVRYQSGRTCISDGSAGRNTGRFDHGLLID